MSAWNYPYVTGLPYVAACISAGNCVVFKPTERAPHCSNIQVKLFEEFLDHKFYRCLEGGVKTSQTLTQSPLVDVIVFTGGSLIGKYVAQSAAKNLTPCILELGGKCPCIVDEDADLYSTANKIVWGNFFNAGQTCIAPDFLFAQKSIREKLIAALTESMHRQLGKSLEYNQSEYLALMINKTQTEKMKSLLDEEHGGQLVIGGKIDIDQKFVQPTIILNPRMDSLMMKEEIFGPILPVIEFENINTIIDWIN